MSIFYKVMTAALALLLSSMLAANNIQGTNLTTTGQNTTEGYILVEFDLKWENSWCSSSATNNWDAARVFVKRLMGIRE